MTALNMVNYIKHWSGKFVVCVLEIQNILEENYCNPGLESIFSIKINSGNVSMIFNQHFGKSNVLDKI